MKMTETINKLYTAKQQQVLNFAFKVAFFILILHGAQRSGKTVVNNDIFLSELRRVRKIADKLGVEHPQYILAGVSLGTIAKNVLIELTNKYGIEFKMDKFNRFELMGVLVCCTGHSKASHLDTIRGMTAFGAYVNEASLADEASFNEIKARCSAPGSRVVADTNPDHPEHYIKTDYIDKADGKTIAEFSFTIDDNTFLDERYVQSIKDSTPTGMFYERNVKGLWVSSDGVVYKDFDKDVHFVDEERLKEINFIRHFAGVDWGYEHHGVIVVVGECEFGDLYLVEEHAHQHREIDDWVKIALSVQSRYGNINFYCDSARPEHVDRFEREGLKAIYADKAILAGVEEVARHIKTRRFFVVKSRCPRFVKEIYMYVWNEKAGVPIKLWDDVMDATRYAIYTDKSYQPSFSFD